MTQFSRIGLDTSKALFTLHCVDAAGKPMLRVELRRPQLIPFFKRHAPTVVALEACGGSHHWARKLMALGHEVRLSALTA
jgi:transposase